jgi:alginate O-acetyltransferase complex protein AlgJ
MTPSLPPSPHAKPPNRIARMTSGLGGIVLVLVILAGLVSTLFSIWRGNLDLFPHGVSWTTFMNGRVTKTMADSLARAPLPSEFAKLERGLSWMAVGDLGPRVRQGCPGWLYLTDEFTPYPHARQNAADRIKDIDLVQSELAKRQIALIVVVVPDKSRMEAAHLCDLQRAASLGDRLSSWVSDVKAAGIDVVNVQPPLASLPATADGTHAFLRTDTHWNEEGAARAAQEVARQVNARMTALNVKITPQVNYTLTSTRGVRPGDLSRLAGVEWLPPSLQPAVETAQSTTFKADAEEAKGASSADDLFGDSNLPNIALIGTSFSRTSNFVPFLQSDLHTRIGSFAKDGGDFSGSARDYFASQAFKQTPPKLLIWEIPERVIEAPRDPAAIWPVGKLAAMH